MEIGEYNEADAAEIVTWPSSEAEARAWCGEPAPDAEAMARWHRDPDVRGYVLRSAADLIAYGEVWADDNEVELGRLIVRPELRGRGVGRQLIEKLMRVAPPLQAFVRVVPENAPAIRCYEAAGFERVAADQEAAYNQAQPRAYVWMRRRAP